MSKSTPGLHGVVEVKKPVVLDREERLRRSSSAMGALAVPLSMIDDLEAKKKQSADEELRLKSRPATALANAARARHPAARQPTVRIDSLLASAAVETAMVEEAAAASRQRALSNARRRQHAELSRQRQPQVVKHGRYVRVGPSQPPWPPRRVIDFGPDC